MVLVVGQRLSLRALREAAACRTRQDVCAWNPFVKKAGTVQMNAMSTKGLCKAACVKLPVRCIVCNLCEAISQLGPSQ